MRDLRKYSKRGSSRLAYFPVKFHSQKISVSDKASCAEKIITFAYSLLNNNVSTVRGVL